MSPGNIAKAVIRPAAQADALGISQIYNHYVVDSTASFAMVEESVQDRAIWIANHLRADMPVLVAEYEGEVIAYASASPYHSRCAYRGTVELSIYIRPDSCSAGLGKRLLQDLVSRCTAYHTLLALICAENQASLKLFANYGFVECGRLRQVGYKFERYLDVVIMQYLRAQKQ